MTSVLTFSIIQNMNKKILFFDIDGTLWNWKNEIPDSTAEAIRRVRKAGHLAFINTGRTRGFVRNEALLDIGFDGIVSGCGTMIEYDGRVVYDSRIPREQAIEIVEAVRRYGCRPILEGSEYLYMDDEDFKNDWYAKKLIRELGDRLKSIKNEWGSWEIQKLSLDIREGDIEGCEREYGDRYDFIKHDVAVCELVPSGFSKGTGVIKVCELLDIPVSDSFAFGDSVNDTAMLITAGTGIVMGSARDGVKDLADYVSTPQEEDGIWNACRHFGLM